MAKTASYFGNHPCKPNEKRPVHITRDKMIMFIYTPEKPFQSDLNWVLASSDKLTSAMYQLAPGSSFDPVDIHPGDEVYYILRGTVTMLNPAIGQVVDVSKGEAIFLPKGAPHKAYNFGAEEARMLVVIAPKIWDKEGNPLSYGGTMKLLKYEGKGD
jgi:mannose-6-phosphate isomerase-like protein (cupin superfamily)